MIVNHVWTHGCCQFCVDPSFILGTRFRRLFLLFLLLLDGYNFQYGRGVPHLLREMALDSFLIDLLELLFILAVEDDGILLVELHLGHPSGI